MTSEVDIRVGETLDEFLAMRQPAARQIDAGELTGANAEHHVSFENFTTFVSILTPKRLALLRHVHREPPRSIRALAIALGRDYRRVHDDVEALASAGLLERGPDGLRAEYDVVHIETSIAL